MTVINHFGYESLRGNFNSLLHSRSRTMSSCDDTDYTDYRFEVARLNSFVNWTVPFMDPKKLAAAGFYYTGEGDQVRCFECKCNLHRWKQGDNIMVEHQRWSGRCRFLRNIPCGNVPIGVDPNTIPPYTKEMNVSDLYGLKYKPYSGPDKSLSIKDWMRSNTNFLEKNSNNESDVLFDTESNTKSMTMTEVGDIVGSKYPHYASYTQRLQSLKLWPEGKSQKKEDLAAAGFFYIGYPDETFCYYCGVGLKKWEPTDDPVQEHIKWSPKCLFIKKIQTKKQSKKNDDQCVPDMKTENVDLSRESTTSSDSS